jgi:glycosyltransferase involved in cell wall biosynthesis
MKLLAVSEHYFPRVGGTVNYVHETLCALAAEGVEAELLVPGPEPIEWLPEGMARPPYNVTWLNADYPPKGDPGREQRYDFCQQVDAYVAAAVEGPDKPDILHVLFGIFVMEIVDTVRLRRAGIPSLATVHNVPPMECRQIAHNAPLAERLKEALRLKAVTFKNRARLKKNTYDLYVVPSRQVETLLSPVVGDRVAVIGHGTTSDLQAIMAPPHTRRTQGPVTLLTVGGYVPHKRQHLIPQVADKLRASGIEFMWHVAGPPGRVRNYRDQIAQEVTERGLDAQVVLHGAVSFGDLAALYDRAHLYVQPSIEEGFCLTALDAAAVGLPVIGCRAGALPEIIKISGGTLIDSTPDGLAVAIGDFVRDDRWQDTVAQRSRVAQTFSWAAAAAALKTHYEELRHE